MQHLKIIELSVSAALSGRRLGVSDIGRALQTGTSPKHAIKRVDRFLGNRCFDIHVARVALLRTVVGVRKRVLIAVDWTMVLLAAWAHFFAILAGAESRRRSRYRHYQTNTVASLTQHSDFTLGIYYLPRLLLKLLNTRKLYIMEADKEIWG